MAPAPYGSRRPRSRSPRSASRTCWRRRCGASSTTSRPRSRRRRPAARASGRARAGGASVRARATRRAPPLRTVPAGEHVLALPDDGEYLRVGDGFILMSELDLLLDDGDGVRGRRDRRGVAAAAVAC